MGALRRLAGALAVGLIVTSGCAPDSGIEDRIEDNPGVAGAQVHRSALDEPDYHAVHLVVDMDAGASATQVADTLDEVGDWLAEDRRGEESSSSLTIGAGTTARSDELVAMSGAAQDHDRNLDRARLLLAADKAFEGRVVVQGDRWTVSGPPRDVLAEVLRTPALREAPGLVVESPSGGFASAGPLAEERIALYTQVAGQLPAESMLAFFGSIDSGVPFDTEADRDALAIRVELHGARPAARAVTDPRWPAVRRLLERLRALPEGSTLTVAWVPPLDQPEDPDGGVVVEAMRGSAAPAGLWKAAAAAVLAP